MKRVNGREKGGDTGTSGDETVLVRGEEGVKREMRVDMEGEDTF